ncbi:MAG: hypothetical protein RL071_3278 [Pseudomonadota bacterium]|jgi:hypothetical protein
MSARRLPTLAFALLTFGSTVACMDGELPGEAPAPAECPKPSAAELEKLCGQTPAVSDAISRAEKAQAELGTLGAQLSKAEAELAELEAAARNDQKRAASDEKKRKELAAQVEQLKGKIGEVEAERDSAKAELVATIQRLDAQTAKTEEALAEAEAQRARATGNHWQAFGAEAKVTICDRGGKRRHDKCHEAVTEALRPLTDRFKGCIDSGQAAPELRPLDKDAPLPAHAERLPSNARFTKDGWAVVFCDPTLPERKAEGEGAGEAAPAAD